MFSFRKIEGRKPIAKHLRPFGCAAFVYELNPKSKIHARTISAIILRCNDHVVYTVEKLTVGKVINSFHVAFDE